MREQRAEALQLAVGKPASLMQNGSVRPITREPLSDSQIQGLVREIASAETASQIGFAEVSFAYRSPFGEVQVELKPGANGTALLRLASPAPAAASSRPTAAPAAAPAPASPPFPSAPPARSTQDTTEHRAAIEA